MSSYGSKFVLSAQRERNGHEIIQKVKPRGSQPEVNGKNPTNTLNKTVFLPLSF